MKRTGKIINEHERIVQSKTAHGAISSQRTGANRESLVADEQTAVGSTLIANHVLIASVGQQIDQSVAIACIKLSKHLTVFYGLQHVIYSQFKQALAFCVCCEDAEGWQKVDCVIGR